MAASLRIVALPLLGVTNQFGGAVPVREAVLAEELVADAHGAVGFVLEALVARHLALVSLLSM